MKVSEFKALLAKPKSKYKSIPTIVDGHRFHSKLEATFYCVLKRQWELGEIHYYLMQVPLHLPGGVKMIIDFVVKDDTGDFVYMDVKGMPPTRDWINKKKAAEAHYGITIYEVKTEQVKNLAKQYAIK